ncbi:MAG: aldehyde dehydrogenase family protein [Bacteroidetes Order II. Incertae sedis bacterium]|nr:aldehyde dehydrogenase family protein [Bacteroidetes Order II. bacterium]
MKPNLIAGEWRTPHEVQANINPSDTNDVIDHYALSTLEDIEDAVQAAHVAASSWGRSTPQQRFDLLDKIGSEILARKDELGNLLAREEGKTLPEGIGEATRAGHIFKFFAGEALRPSGEKMASVRPGIEVEITREPIGAVGIITPWNFPIAIPAWKIAPALAYGNTVVFKPAELVPGCAWALADIIHQSGVPEGVFNLVMGKGAVVGKALVAHPNVAGISFTGSIHTGKEIATTCAAFHKKVQLEMGGKNPLVILDDADLDTAVACAINGAFFSTGQRCTASSRLIVSEGIHDRFVEAMVNKLAALKVDDARMPGVEMGPVVDEAQLTKDLHYIQQAVREGARLAFGGQTLQRKTPGFFLAPTLFVETTNEMMINREEVFGPVAGVIRVKDYEEALYVANDTPFGLSTGICTTSLKHAYHFKHHAKAGMVMVNLPTAGVDYHVPFGGTKASSYGAREQGSHAKEFYTTVKTTYIFAG